MSITFSRAGSLHDAIGGTPLLELRGLQTPGRARLFAKAEFMNPGGSVKDRICRSMLDDAQARGMLRPDSVIIESTSGNTGIGLAMLAAERGLECILTMPSTMSQERIKLLRGYGARVELSTAEGGMAEAILLAERLAAQYGERAWMPGQFENQANPLAHSLTTGPEILSQLAGLPLAAFVAGVGTGGTISGTGAVLKKHDQSTRIVAVEPSASPVISGGKPGPHGIQGIGAGFIPDTLNLKILDEVMTVTEVEALETKVELGKRAGLLVGISAGANVAMARRVAQRFDDSVAVVTVLCDTGERYLSLDA